jgi:uncharacterized protein YchJ/organic radical activating enzyme
VHAFEPFSETDGPGVRAVLWLQGCTLGCPGCFARETHGRQGHEVAVDEMFAYIAMLGGRIEGVTISGGEPLQQFRPLLRLLARIREETSLSVLLLTGYSWEEIVRMPGAAALRERVDVLLAGRYERDLRIGHGLRGSSNKTLHLFTDRYTVSDLDGSPARRPGLPGTGRVGQNAGMARCPCGVGDRYRDCCGRLHRGEAAAATAAELMRSRFSAFARQDEAYLLSTWHPATRPDRVGFEDGPRWTRLEIVRTEDGGPGDERGVVEFRAHYLSGSTPGELHEVSRFVRHDGAWVYVRGKIITGE